MQQSGIILVILATVSIATVGLATSTMTAKASFCGWNPDSPLCNALVQHPTITQMDDDDGGWGSYTHGHWHCDWQWDSNGYRVCE